MVRIQENDSSRWTAEKNLLWFSNKTTADILESVDESFKQHLKKNVIQFVGHVNKLFQDKVEAWSYIEPHSNLFGLLLKAVARLAISNSLEFDLAVADRYQILTFLNFCFTNVDIGFVEKQVKRYLSLTIWANLSPGKLELELSKLPPETRDIFRKIQKDTRVEKLFEREFIFKYVQQFFKILPEAITRSQSDDESDNDEKMDTNEYDKDNEGCRELNKDIASYCQRFVEFVIDIESQSLSRRSFHPILDYTNFIERCRASELARHNSHEGHLFGQLIDLLQLYSRYEIDLMTGDSLSDVEMLRKHEAKIMSLQKILWLQYPKLRDFAIKSVRAIDTQSELYKIIKSFDTQEEFVELMKKVDILDEASPDDEDHRNAPLLASKFMNHFRRYESQLQKINSIPLLPNDALIWDTNLVPDQFYNYECPLALPKLNVQFLTMSDYLLRNFMLFKNESTYDIRQDLEDGIVRSKCKWTDEGSFATGPKQRMALIIKSFQILDVGKPRIGEKCPSYVRAKIIINMDYVRPEWRKEWEKLRKHDTCFLISFRKSNEKTEFEWPENSFPAKNNLKYVRGCEIEALLDSEGKIVDENIEAPKFTNNLRTYLVTLDCNQYKLDQDANSDQKVPVYDNFHLMVRRKPEKNNFKGVLETIRSLINSKFVVPSWLQNLLLGYGDPRGAHYSNLLSDSDSVTLDLLDTFLDKNHLLETIQTIRPGHKLTVCDLENDFETTPLYKLKLNHIDKDITVIPYKRPPVGPYQAVIPKRNPIRFTPSQTEAIVSGLQPGLTMIVGPPGTGKTDVAVQILSTLYHTYPNQRTLIVTHSNQSLNQIFDKMVKLDVEEHHLLRLGHGEEDLESSKDFSRQGRVKHVLSKRMELLIRVSKLSRSLDLDPGRGFTCQTADFFRSYHIVSRWNDYLKLVTDQQVSVSQIGDKFPFAKFFADAPQPLFKKQTLEEDSDIAHSCYRYIDNIFEQLKAFRPFEIFQTASDRSQYLMIREAKVIAMTCTHAGLKRKELVELNFQYDNILMEETAQILEIETTIPLLLQNPENGVNRLKRWIMIGDHHQLPPIIQNSAFQKFSNMEQSLFARFIRLGVPTVELDAQGRARASLCDLYRWRYKTLRELEHVETNLEFNLANAGLIYDYQLINVDDFKGIGEFCPQPFAYHNRGEAEHVLALYKYMRLIGYPGDKITILTTYNGQKQLLRDLFERECAGDPYFGLPSKITTVDKFQGQQNDYILLSLVRTKHIGHIRDIRRLVVAMSRARLGLYVFARVSLYKSCFELRNSMRLLLSRPQNLCLTKARDIFPTKRYLNETVDSIEVASLEELQSLLDQQRRKLNSQDSGTLSDS